MKKYNIAWEKWDDPLMFDELDANIAVDNESDSPTIRTKSLKMVITPMGAIPYNETTAASNIFNFWIGHTNFNISKNISDILEGCEGVETLDIFTRYRFRIGIGKAFDAGNVMRGINSKITEYFSHDKCTTN